MSGRKSGVVVGHCKYIYYMQDKPAKQKCREKVEKDHLGRGTCMNTFVSPTCGLNNIYQAVMREREGRN